MRPLKLVEEDGFEPSKLTQQIYSLPPLATRAPLRRERMKLLLKDSKLSRVTDKNSAKRYQVAYHDGSTLINTLFNASF